MSGNSEIRPILALGLAQEQRGDIEAARRAFHEVLRRAPDTPAAHEGLSRLAWSGRPYLEVLRHIHALLRPASYLEIGVAGGDSLRLAAFSTRIVGVDPEARDLPAQTHLAQTRLISKTSRAALDDGDLDRALDGGGFDFAFIDGSHRFEAVIADILGIERLARRHALIAVHDTLPLDAATSSPERRTQFWTGDGWKAIVCLRRLRPELTVTTIATAPSGLTLIRGFSPGTATPTDLGAALAEARTWGFEDFAPRIGCFALRAPDTNAVVHTLIQDHGISAEPDSRRG